MTTPSVRMILADRQGKPLIELADSFEQLPDGRWAFQVQISDQTTPAFFVKANKVTGETTLTAQALLDDKSITVADDGEVNVGDYLGLFNTDTNRYYAGTVLAKPGAGVITLDLPLDSQFEIDDVVGAGITNMAVDGASSGGPIIFGLRGNDPGIDLTIDVTRIIISCVTDTAVDLTKFADLAALTNGLLMRRVDGFTQNIVSWKTNAEITGSMFDWTVFEAGVGQQGIDGFAARLTFGGPSKLGVVQRIGPGQDLQFIVQDDLSGITKLEIMIEGHVVQ